MITAPPTTADGMSRPQTVAKEIPPAKLRPGLNVYHPKPIPPPEMLPLTRTVSTKSMYVIYSNSDSFRLWSRLYIPTTCMQFCSHVCIEIHLIYTCV